MSRHIRDLLRWSLVIVWLGTAWVSWIERDGIGRDLLVQANIAEVWIAPAILAGIAVDLALGVLLLLRPRRWVYAAAMVMMLVMTAIATILQPSLWLHPLGPLLKNIPLAALLWALMKEPT
ncbi:DoxX-like family protein [Curvibacter sp. CHRR-16]|uniref:DoxX-like family protein n=1 Tax=Curvibacter sp. CHRR-16 TaxID=2835872 RepID=UPI001BDAC23F|nr:DoxX-like family protein [Curvibacter sp. CHRR-16]MBT0571065.1 DoxX-like family protein [Curvibacter sp. CHRR-16]